jgi:hypothetical protein
LEDLCGLLRIHEIFIKVVFFAKNPIPRPCSFAWFHEISKLMMTTSVMFPHMFAKLTMHCEHSISQQRHLQGFLVLTPSSCITQFQLARFPITRFFSLIMPKWGNSALVESLLSTVPLKWFFSKTKMRAMQGIGVHGNLKFHR